MARMTLIIADEAGAIREIVDADCKETACRKAGAKRQSVVELIVLGLFADTR